jgi:predicted anti-sigma-YlaC factor YlaD
MSNHIKGDALRAAVFDKWDLVDDPEKVQEHLVTCKACREIVSRAKEGNQLLRLIRETSSMSRDEAWEYVKSVRERALEHEVDVTENKEDIDIITGKRFFPEEKK